MAKKTQQEDLTPDQIRVGFSKLKLDKKVEVFNSIKEDLDSEKIKAQQAIQLLSQINTIVTEEWKQKNPTRQEL